MLGMESEKRTLQLNELLRAVDLAKGQSALARLINQQLPAEVARVQQQHVWSWINRTQQIHANYAIPCEIALNGNVRASALRPDLYGHLTPQTHSSPSEASEAITLDGQPDDVALSTQALPSSDDRGGTTPATQGQPRMRVVRRRRRTPTSSSSSSHGGGTAAPAGGGNST